MVSLTGGGDFHRVPVWDPWALPTPIRPAISQDISRYHSDVTKWQQRLRDSIVTSNSYHTLS